MEVIIPPDAFNAPERDNEWLHLDAEELAAATATLVRALAREGLMYGVVNRHDAVTGAAQKLQQYLETRQLSLGTEDGRANIPTTDLELLGNASGEPMPVKTALDIVDVVL